MKHDFFKNMGFAIAIPPTFMMVQIPEENIIPAKKWRRYRFYTKSVDDYRPLVFDPRFPWWCSGFSVHGTFEGMDCETAVIIAWLPFDEILKNYWDDAAGVEFTEHEQIEFTDRFPKPDWFIEK